MKNKQGYSTARATAAIRAMHLLYDRPVVFADPYAIQFTGPAFRRICRGRFLPWLLRRRSISEIVRPISAQILSRAKFTEEKLKQAVIKGISQYVIIGAGFDTFCLRRPDFSVGLRIYEIDHPVTQRIKRKRLIDIWGSVPDGVEFLAIDLEKRTINDAFSDSSLMKEEKVLFSWLGTIPYLTEDAVHNVLHDLASFAVPGSEIVLDYLIPTATMNPEDRRVLRRGMRIIELLGEPVKSYFDPEAFPDVVSNHGYHIFENQSPTEQNRKYFSGRSDNLATHSSAYNLHAVVI